MHKRSTDRRNYPAERASLNRELKAIEQCDSNLLNVVERLREHQLDTGFIRDDLYAIKYFDFPHPDHPERFLSVQYNPARVNRLKIHVSALPPKRNDVVNDGCMLCSNNIEWQHRGIEMGYAIDLNGIPFNMLMNAYPLMPAHLVVVTDEHVPQAWDLGDAGSRRFTIDEVVTNLATMAQRLPGYVGFYNGDGAGTSVPAHFHYQLFRRRNGSDRFPLELAPVRQVADLAAEVVEYPVSAMRWSGDDRQAVIARAAAWIDEWLRVNLKTHPYLSGNIFAMTDDSGEQLQVYFVPRDKQLVHSPRMTGMIGSLEILGELVLTTAREKRDLDWGRIDYCSIARILSDINVPL
jgi:diadenosine tetraphosphate (Ap4A) HIT family hydrolase